jgi:hypothetical protein
MLPAVPGLFKPVPHFFSANKAVGKETFPFTERTTGRAMR